MSMKMEELLQLIDAVSESDLTELEKETTANSVWTADRRGVMYGRNCAAESRIK